MEFQKAEQDLLAQLKTDFVPFHDVFRSLFGFLSPQPNRQQIITTFEFFYLFVNKYSLKILDGLEQETNARHAEQVIISAFEQGKYDEVNYRFWLDFSASPEQ